MIKFPRVHIANSVVNRMLNVADGVERARAVAIPHVPNVPDTADQSDALDAALGTAPPAMPGIDSAPDAGATLAGKPLLTTVLEPGD